MSILFGTLLNKLLFGASFIAMLWGAKCAYDARLLKKGEQIGVDKTVNEVNAGTEKKTREADKKQDEIIETIDKELKEVNKEPKSVERSGKRLDIIIGK